MVKSSATYLLFKINVAVTMATGSTRQLGVSLTSLTSLRLIATLISTHSLRAPKYYISIAHKLFASYRSRRRLQIFALIFELFMIYCPLSYFYFIAALYMYIEQIYLKCNFTRFRFLSYFLAIGKTMYVNRKRHWKGKSSGVISETLRFFLVRGKSKAKTLLTYI